MTSAVIGLGGNLGDPETTMRAALDRLASHPDISVAAVSALYETPPWGRTDQPAFLNAAARLETGLAPRALLDIILAVERDLGRERAERWGPRLIDIDILLYGDATVDEPGLTIPHPRLAERAFALMPLRDVAPGALIGGRTPAAILDGLDTTGIVRRKDEWWSARAKSPSQSSGSPT